MTYLIALGLSILMVVICFVVHYTGLRLLADRFFEHGTKHPHRRFILVMLAIFCLHVLEVMIFGLGYSIAEQIPGLGYLRGDQSGNLFDDTYVSAVIYSSLGFGDILPVGAIRIMASFQVIAGLLLIGWSTSFSFLLMQKLWQHHPHHQKHH